MTQHPIREPAAGKITTKRAIHDAHHSFNDNDLPGTLVRAEGQDEVKDKVVNEAYDNIGTVLKFYKEHFNWSSIDNKNAKVVSSVHFGKDYENACKSFCPEPQEGSLV